MHRVLLTALLLAGCRNIEPVPEDLDGLVRRSFAEFDTGDEALWIELRDALAGVTGEGTLDEPIEGTVTPLTDEDSAWAAVGADPSLASGIVLGAWLDCPLPLLAETLSHPQQDLLYDGSFTEFERTYTTPRADFLAGGDRLEWRADFALETFLVSYAARTDGRMRRIGDELLVRTTVMPAPAQMAGETEQFIDQDYQLEVYWADEDGARQVYTMWRHSRIAGFEDEDEAAQRVGLNALADWGEETVAACATVETGGP